MILSFDDQATMDIFDGRATTAAERRAVGWRRSNGRVVLEILDQAIWPGDLDAIPAIRLEVIDGPNTSPFRQGSFRISTVAGQRIRFDWIPMGPKRVRLEDMSSQPCDHDMRRSGDTEGRQVIDWSRVLSAARVPIHRPPVHPGELLRSEFLEPFEITQVDLADGLGVSYKLVNELVNGRRGITPSTALRLSRLLGPSGGFWMNGQVRWDLYTCLQREQRALRRISLHRR